MLIVHLMSGAKETPCLLLHIPATLTQGRAESLEYSHLGVRSKLKIGGGGRTIPSSCVVPRSCEYVLDTSSSPLCPPLHDFLDIRDVATQPAEQKMALFLLSGRFF